VLKVNPIIFAASIASPEAGCSKSKTGVHTATAFPGGVEERTEVTVTVPGCSGDDVEGERDGEVTDAVVVFGGGVDAPAPDGFVPPPHADKAAVAVAAADHRPMRIRRLIAAAPSRCRAFRVR
jgi:hypothetical protein